MKLVSILLIEDEIPISDMIQFSLPSTQYSITAVTQVSLAKTALLNHIPDIIILDWMLPKESGPSFLKWMREQDSFQHIPVIMLTAKAEEANKVSMLMLGADDYMTKPFSPKELMARIQAILRRGPIANNQNEITVGPFTLNYLKQEVLINKQVLSLTAKEYKTIELFLRHPQQKFSREKLINLIWGHDSYIDDRTVDVHIRRLRDKLKPYLTDQYIHTQRGMGYYFKEPVK